MFPSTTPGPVQPFGVSRMIMGQIGRSLTPSSLAFRWFSLISAMQQSTASAIFSCISIGSLPLTKYGFQPQPLKNHSLSSFEIRANTVGLLILYPLRCRIGSTAPSFFALRNLFECHAVARGPVSASPSPTTQAAMRSGLSKTAPKAWASE